MILTDLTCLARDPNCCKDSLCGGLEDKGQGGMKGRGHDRINIVDCEV